MAKTTARFTVDDIDTLLGFNNKAMAYSLVRALTQMGVIEQVGSISGETGRGRGLSVFSFTGAVGRTFEGAIAPLLDGASNPEPRPVGNGRKASVAAAPAEEAPVEAEAPAKPKRSRKKASTGKKASTPAKSAEAPAKPKRPSRKKKAAEAPVEDLADSPTV